MKPTPEMIEVACKAHTPQFDRMDPDLQVYARQQMEAALSAALSVPAAAVVGEPAIEHAEWLEACATNEPSQNDAEKLWTCAQLIRTLASRISQQDAELERLRREVEEARAALKPFAERAARFDDIPGIYRCNDNVELWQDGNWRCDLTVGDLRKARSAIAVISEAEEART